MKDFISSQNNDKYFEKDPVENQAERTNEFNGKGARNGQMNAAYDLKLDDTASEDLKQMNDLINIESSVQDQPVTPTNLNGDEDESLDFRNQGITNSLNEQQGRNVITTYAS